MFRSWVALVAVAGLAAPIGCKRLPAGGAAGDAGAEGNAPSASAPAGEAQGPAGAQGKNSVAQALPPSMPMLGITAFEATVYAEPRDTSKKLGYLRVGSRVGKKSAEPVGKANC